MPPHGNPPLACTFSNVESYLQNDPDIRLDQQVVPSALFDVSENNGNKPIFNTGLHRIKTFAGWAMKREEEYIVVAGHSLWFKGFFNAYLTRKTVHGPNDPAHDAKDCKMKNGGAVAFDLEFGKVNGKDVYRIDHESMRAITPNLGFDNKKKLKKIKKEEKKLAKKKNQ